MGHVEREAHPVPLDLQGLGVQRRGERREAVEGVAYELGEAPSPDAQRNSSKSSGQSSSDRSSEGMRMPSMFLLMEMSDPVST